MFEIHVGELRATFLRNHNMRRHKDPKRKTTQAQKAPTSPATTTSTGALHPLRGGAPEQKRCIAYGSGALPQDTRTNAELAHRITHRHTPPCAAGPYWRQDGHAAHAAHAATCTPAHSSPLRPTPTPPTPLHAKSRFSRPSAGLRVSRRPGRAAGCRSGPAGARGDHASRGQARAARAAAATTGH